MTIRLPALVTLLVWRPTIGFDNSSSTAIGNDTPVQGFEKLNKYANCSGKVDPYMVYARNLALSPERVVKAGQDAGLIEQETVAIFGWTLGDFSFLNKIAWGSDEVKFGVEPFGYPTCTLDKAQVSPYIEVLVSALEKLPPAQPATLWRGSKRNSTRLGKVITGGFSSTSRDFDAAFNFVKTQGGSLWAIEGHTSGKDISAFSDRPAEGEVLFAAGSSLDVVECSPTTVDDARRQKIKEAEENLQKHTPTAKIEIICMKGGVPSNLLEAHTFITV